MTCRPGPPYPSLISLHLHIPACWTPVLWNSHMQSQGESQGSRIIHGKRLKVNLLRRHQERHQGSGKLNSLQNLEAWVTGEKQFQLNHRGWYQEQLEPNKRDPLRLIKTFMAVITQSPFQLHFCYCPLMPPNYVPREKPLYFTNKEMRQGHDEAQGLRCPAGWGWGGTAAGDQASCWTAQWPHSCARDWVTVRGGRKKQSGLESVKPTFCLLTYRGIISCSLR